MINHSNPSFFVFLFSWQNMYMETPLKRHEKKKQQHTVVGLPPFLFVNQTSISTFSDDRAAHFFWTTCPDSDTDGPGVTCVPGRPSHCLHVWNWLYNVSLISQYTSLFFVRWRLRGKHERWSFLRWLICCWLFRLWMSPWMYPLKLGHPQRPPALLTNHTKLATPQSKKKKKLSPS